MSVERVTAQPTGEPESTAVRSPAPGARLPPLGRGLRPADALALQRTAGNRALVQALQRYTEKKYTNTWRQADDMSLATRTGYPNHELWAKPGKAAKSNTALAAVKSDIELVETAKEDTFWTDDKSVTVKLQEDRGQEQGQRHPGRLDAAVGGLRSQRVGGRRRASTARRSTRTAGGKAVAPGGPDQMKAGIMKTWLAKREDAQKLMVEANKVDADAIQDALTKGAQREAELGRHRRTAGARPRADVMKKAIAAEYSAQAHRDRQRPISPTSTPAADAERQAIDQDLGINWYARPGVGQGYTTSSGGAAVPGSTRTWNFHWSGVVMTERRHPRQRRDRELLREQLGHGEQRLDVRDLRARAWRTRPSTSSTRTRGSTVRRRPR